jgi:hypothetical protein
MKDIFKGKLAIIAGTTFMIPSFIFWTSGIHKDGIVFLAIGLTTYHLYNYFKNKQSKKSLLYITLLLIGLFPLRNYVVLAMIPAIFAWWWSTKMNSNKWLPFVLTGIACISILFTTKYIFPKINLPVAIVMKQNSFRALGGESILPQPSLSSDIRSFIKNAPNALNHALARPYLNEADSIAVFLSALEIILFWLFVFIWFFRYSDNPYRHPTIMFLLMISISVLLLTGYIVPQMGAIVRYRSIFLPLIIIPVMCTTKWRKTY